MDKLLLNSLYQEILPSELEQPNKWKKLGGKIRDECH